MGFFTIAFAAFEVLSRVYFPSPLFEAIFEPLYLFFPSTYTPGEMLRVMRQLFPTLLTFIVFVLDHTLDALPISEEDPLVKLKTIKSRQENLLKEAKDVLDYLKRAKEQ